MQRKLVFCVFAITFFSSCGYYEHKQRQMLLSQIKVTNDSLDKMTKDWHLLLDRAVKTKSFSDLNACRISLGQFISRKRSTIADMELPADAEPLRGSEGVFLSTQSGMVSDVYPKFEAYNDSTPDSTIQNQWRQVSNDLQTEVSWNLTMKKALDAFALKNNIKPINK